MNSQSLDTHDYDAHKDVLRKFLTEQTHLLDMTIHSIMTGTEVEKKDKLAASQLVVDTVFLMIQGLGVSCHSIVRLTDKLDMSIRDCFTIARSIVEGGVNVAYIIAGGNDIAERAQRHALQKAYRDIDRRGEIGGIQMTIGRLGKKHDPSSIPGLAKALEEFTDKKGRERTNWTNDNLDHRIKLIATRFEASALSFAGSTVSIYRHSSEILHGTFFGVQHFWTAGLERPKTRKEVEYLFLTNHLVAVFSATFFSLHGVVEVVSNEFGISAISRRNATLLKAVSEFVERDLSKVRYPGQED